MSKTEVVYAIRVIGTKDGKKRVKKAWATEYNGDWDIYVGSLPGISRSMNVRVRPEWYWKLYGDRDIDEAEAALGCKCKVVAIEVRERPE
ncbi:MAG: hypothetical protein IIB83_08815 [Bacteroidetes bacterium]|nr:hypothetical protein [Bacteroidota bacterium]